MGASDDAFLREARSQIRALNDGLLAAERDADGDVDDLFRTAHSLKGSCRAVGLRGAGDVAHALEDVLDAVRGGDVELTASLVDDALDAVDRLETIVEAAATGDDDADVTETCEALRSSLAAERERAASAGRDSASGDGAGSGPDLDDEDLDDDVAAALADAAEFDDIDALLDDMDDPEGGDLDGWGLLDADEAGAPGERDVETPDDPSAFFEEAKSELGGDEPGVEELQTDIDAVEFDELDGGDGGDGEFTIEELIALDPDDVPEDAAPSPSDPDAGVPGTGGPDGTDASGSPPDEAAGVGSPATDPADTDATEPAASAGDDSVVAGGDADVADGSASAAGDGADAADDPDGGFVFDQGVTADDGPDDESGDADADADDAPDDATEADPTPADEVGVADVPGPEDVPDVDLDVDLDAPLDDADLPDDPGIDVSVDDEMAAFEDRFAGLLDDDSGGGASEQTAGVRSAVGTIEESRLEDARFGVTAADESDGTRETDRLPAMTVDVETADRLLNVAEELSLTHLRLEDAVGPETDPAIREEVSNLLHAVTEYRRTVMDVRLVSLESAIDTVPRTVRDVARSQGKRVDLATENADVELDRSIVDRLRDPLVHLARNAVDHGVEPPEEREDAGKPREGTVEIRADRDRDEVVIELVDDGRGVDTDAVRRRAVERDVVTAGEAAELTDDEVYDLLFEPGFTTTDEVTDVSGRGVGMDVVRRTVADLNGSIAVESDPGEGTTVRLTVPVSIALTEVLFVEVAEETFGIPMTAVEQVTPSPSIETVDDREVVRRSTLDVAGELPEGVDATDPYPVVRLESALEVPGTDDGPDDAGRTVWIQPGIERLAVRCDRVVGSQEVVIRPYEDLLRDVPVVSGATTLGDGQAVNVLDVRAL